MNHLLLILSFIVSLITTNPIVDSSQWPVKGDTISDSNINYFENTDSIEYNVETEKDICQIVDTNCATCKTCSNSWLNLFLGIVAAVIALITLIVTQKQLKLSYQQAKNSNQQSESSNILAQKSYKSFMTESEKQYNLQQETLKTIVRQTDKIYATKKKSEIIDHFTNCYTLIETMYNYLKKHFGDALKDTKEFSDFVFESLRPVVKDASAIKMLMGEQNTISNEFSNALDICTNLMNLQINNQKDMDDLIEHLETCKKAFENQKHVFDKELKEK